jgi:hypothetical protein
MPTVVKSSLPDHSILKQSGNTYDFVDSYQSSFYDKEQTIGAAQIGKLFFTSGPKWIERLFTVRNRIVGVLGLKTAGKISDRQQQLDNFKCEPGEQLGLFKVFGKTEHEVILGEDDKHLNFRISLFLDGQPALSGERTLTITTTVQFNNAFGRLYFLPVRPFHKRIVPTMLKGIIRQIEATQHQLT